MQYLPVLVLMAIGVLVGCAALAISHFLGPKLPNHVKDMAFECGTPPTGDAHRKISVRFYLVAILFLLFDIEGIFFFPFAVVYRKFLSINAFILLEMGFFVGILLVGYWYVLRKGALEWE